MKLIRLGILRPFLKVRGILNTWGMSPSGDLMVVGSEEGELSVYDRDLRRLCWVDDMTEGNGFPWLTVLSDGVTIAGASPSLGWN